MLFDTLTHHVVCTTNITFSTSLFATQSPFNIEGASQMLSICNSYQYYYSVLFTDHNDYLFYFTGEATQTAFADPYQTQKSFQFGTLSSLSGCY